MNVYVVQEGTSFTFGPVASVFSDRYSAEKERDRIIESSYKHNTHPEDFVTIEVLVLDEPSTKVS